VEANIDSVDLLDDLKENIFSDTVLDSLVSCVLANTLSAILTTIF